MYSNGQSRIFICVAVFFSMAHLCNGAFWLEPNFNFFVVSRTVASINVTLLNVTAFKPHRYRISPVVILNDTSFADINFLHFARQDWVGSVPDEASVVPFLSPMNMENGSWYSVCLKYQDVKDYEDFSYVCLPMRYCDCECNDTAWMRVRITANIIKKSVSITVRTTFSDLVPTLLNTRFNVSVVPGHVYELCQQTNDSDDPNCVGFHYANLNPNEGFEPTIAQVGYSFYILITVNMKEAHKYSLTPVIHKLPPVNVVLNSTAGRFTQWIIHRIPTPRLGQSPENTSVATNAKMSELCESIELAKQKASASSYDSFGTREYLPCLEMFAILICVKWYFGQ